MSQLLVVWRPISIVDSIKENVQVGRWLVDDSGCVHECRATFVTMPCFIFYVLLISFFGLEAHLENGLSPTFAADPEVDMTTVPWR